MRSIVHSEQGFSLMELIIVMAIMGVLSGSALVSFVSQLPHHRLNGATRGLVSDLRWARQLALAERQPVSVVFDLEKERYQIERSSKPGLPVGWVRDLQDRRSGFGEIDLVNSTGGPVISFQPNGITTNWTTITLRNSRNEQRQMTVILTGRVKIL